MPYHFSHEIFITQGAFAGLASGIGFVGWLTVGVQISVSEGLAVYDVLPLSTEGCSAVNATVEAASK